MLSGKVALVTGAGSGVGHAIADALAQHQATVCLTGRTRAKLEAVAASLPGGPHLPLATDLAADQELDDLIRTLWERAPTLDILVLSAGMAAHGTHETASVEQLDRLYRTNVRANYRLVQGLLPRLKESRGHLVVINSSVALSARPNAGQYSSTQHALRAMTDALRAEVNEHGVGVLSVYLGRTATPMQEALYRERGEEYRPELLLQPEDVATMVVSALALAPTAEVTEISIRPRIKSY